MPGRHVFVVILTARFLATLVLGGCCPLMRATDIVACSISFAAGSLLTVLSLLCIWRERFYVTDLKNGGGGGGSSAGVAAAVRPLPSWSYFGRRGCFAASLFLFGRGVIVFGITGAPKALYLLTCNVDINIVMCGLAIVCYCYAEAVWQSMENLDKGRFPRWFRFGFVAILVEHLLAPVVSVVLAVALDSSLMPILIYLNWLLFCSFLFFVMWGCFLFLARFISQLRFSAHQLQDVADPAHSQMLSIADAASAKLRSFRNMLLAVSVLLIVGVVVSIFSVRRTLVTASNEATKRFLDTPSPSTLDASLFGQTLGIALGVWFCWVRAAASSNVVSRVRCVPSPAVSSQQDGVVSRQRYFDHDQRLLQQKRTKPAWQQQQQQRVVVPIAAWPSRTSSPHDDAAGCGSTAAVPDNIAELVAAAAAAGAVGDLCLSPATATISATATTAATLSPMRSPIRSPLLPPVGAGRSSHSFSEVAHLLPPTPGAAAAAADMAMAAAAVIT